MVSYVPGLSLLSILASVYRGFPSQLTAVQYIQAPLLLLLLMHSATARLARRQCRTRELAAMSAYSPGPGLGCVVSAAAAAPQ